MRIIPLVFFHLAVVGSFPNPNCWQPPLFTEEVCCGSTGDWCWYDGYTAEACCPAKSPKESIATADKADIHGAEIDQGEPICWAVNGLSYHHCCMQNSESGNCWIHGLTNFDRCCNKPLQPCLTNPEALHYMKEFALFSQSRQATPAFLATFRGISRKWPCDEAVAAMLLQTVESTPHQAFYYLNKYITFANLLIHRIDTRRKQLSAQERSTLVCEHHPQILLADKVAHNSTTYTNTACNSTLTAQSSSLETQFIQFAELINFYDIIHAYRSHVLDLHSQLQTVTKPEYVEMVLPYCGENMQWLVDGAKSRSFVSVLVSLAIYNKCPQRSDANSKAAELAVKLGSVFRSVKVVDVWETVMVSECTAYLTYLSQYDRTENNNSWTMFLHPDVHEHVGDMGLWWNLLTFASLGWLNKINQDLGFMSMSVNHLNPFWTSEPEYRFRYKKFYAQMFGLQSAALAPDPLKDSGAYCCSQFIVRNDRLMLRGNEFYQNALSVVNDAKKLSDSIGFDGYIGPFRFNNKVRNACNFMEPMWQVFFGDQPNAPSRMLHPKVPFMFQTTYVLNKYFLY